MKQFYIACMAEMNGKKWACVMTVTQSCNLVSAFDNVIAANICETKKHAFELVDAWNRQFKERGEYI